MLNIQTALVANGHLTRLYQLKRESISPIDRRIIMRIRNAAIEAGYSQRGINSSEMWGERGGVRPSGRLIDAEFVGLQNVGRGKITMRLYNIEGFHALTGSTVGVMSLVHMGVIPRDINLLRVGYEYAKEVFLLAWDQVDILRFKLIDWMRP